MRNKLVKKDIIAMFEMYDEGITKVEIAKRLGVSEAAIRYRLGKPKPVKATSLNDASERNKSELKELTQMIMNEIKSLNIPQKQIKVNEQVNTKSIDKQLESLGNRIAILEKKLLENPKNVKATLDSILVQVNSINPEGFTFRQIVVEAEPRFISEHRVTRYLEERRKNGDIFNNGKTEEGLLWKMLGHDNL